MLDEKEAQVSATARGPREQADRHARWLGIVVGLALVLVVAGAVTLGYVVSTRAPTTAHPPAGPAAVEPPATTTPSPVPAPEPNPDATPSPAPAPAPEPAPERARPPAPGRVAAAPSEATATSSPTPAVDCSVAPPADAFVVGGAHPCFVPMGERIIAWLGGTTLPDGEGSAPSTVLGTDEVTNIRHVQLVMGAPATGALTPQQWTRLMSSGPPAVTEVRMTGIGPLWFGMSADEVDASGVASIVSPGDDDPLPVRSVRIPGADVLTCLIDEEFVGVAITHPSTVSTLEGITTLSSDDDLRATFGDRLLTRTVDDRLAWVNEAVYEGDHGYGFMRQGDGPLVIVAGTREFVDSTAGLPHGICHV